MGFWNGMIVLWDRIFSSHQIRLFEIASLDVKFQSWVNLYLWDSVQPAKRVKMEHSISALSPFLFTQHHNSFFAWYPLPLSLPLVSLRPGWLLSGAYLLLGPDLASRHALLLSSFCLEHVCHHEPWMKLFLIRWQIVTLVTGWPICCTILLKWIKIDNRISGVRQ